MGTGVIYAVLLLLCCCYAVFRACDNVWAFEITCCTLALHWVTVIYVSFFTRVRNLNQFPIPDNTVILVSLRCHMKKNVLQLTGVGNVPHAQMRKRVRVAGIKLTNRPLDGSACRCLRGMLCRSTPIPNGVKWCAVGMAFQMPLILS